MERKQLAINYTPQKKQREACGFEIRQDIRLRLVRFQAGHSTNWPAGTFYIES